MTPCSLPNQPELMSTSLFSFDISELERRFLRGWWTRGVLPADQFVATNWAGLIIPKSIEFTASDIIISYPGRWWGSPDCPNTLPKVMCRITGICHRGRVQIHSHVEYGNKIVRSLYIGHNGRNKLDAVPLEDLSFSDQCSIPRQAGIPEEKSNTIEIEHFLDWVNACITSGAQVIGEPGDFWINAFADYLETDFKFAPCIGCEFPIDNSTAPNIQVGNWYPDIAQLAAKDIKALFDAIVTGSVPTSFAVPICPNSFWLDVSAPSLSAQAHVRLFDVCGGLEDSVYLFDVPATQLVNCFIVPEPDTWPDPKDPRWENLCPPNEIKTCGLNFNASNTLLKAGETRNSPQAGSEAHHPFQSFYFTPTLFPQRVGNKMIIMGVRCITVKRNILTTYTSFGYSGPVVTQGCVTLTTSVCEIVHTEEVDSDKYGARRSQLNSQNVGNECSGPIDTSGGPQPGNPNPPPPDLTDGPPGPPRGNGNCFLEGEIAYNVRVNTVLGEFSFRASKSFRAKVPSNFQIGPVSASSNGNNITLSVPLLGSYDVDITSAIAHYNSYSAAVVSTLPVSFGLQNVRRICP